MDESGHGGFGSVFVAKPVQGKEKVAIKRMSHDTEKEMRNNGDEIVHLKRVSVNRAKKVVFMESSFCSFSVIIPIFVSSTTLTYRVEKCGSSWSIWKAGRWLKRVMWAS